VEDALERQLQSRGFLARILGTLTKAITRPAQVYPVGLLFGVGFDTATEVALLVLAGTGAAAGVPWYAVLVLPLLFAAGMSLLDCLDGLFMSIAYDWAFLKPVRKVYYNLVITGLSIVVAVFIGGLEVAQVLATQLELSGGFWDYASGFDLNRAGFLIVGIFVGIWVLALGIWRFGRVEERWETSAAAAQAAALIPEQAA